jgi:hypothetical protein
MNFGYELYCDVSHEPHTLEVEENGQLISTKNPMTFLSFWRVHLQQPAAAFFIIPHNILCPDVVSLTYFFELLFEFYADLRFPSYFASRHIMHRDCLIEFVKLRENFSLH